MGAVRLAAGLALFAAVAAGTTLPAAARADSSVTAWLQRAVPAGDVPAAALALLGDPEVIPALAAAGLAFLLLQDKRHGRASLWLAAGTAGVSVVTDVFQNVVVHPGPPAALTRPIAERGVAFFGYREVALALAAAGLVLLLCNRPGRRALLWLAAGAAAVSVVTIVFQDAIVEGAQLMLAAVGLNSTYGFPSGHMVRTTFLAGTALRRIPIAGAAIVASMAASLVYLGVHSTSEVVGGFCLGWACVEGARGAWELLGHSTEELPRSQRQG